MGGGGAKAKKNFFPRKLLIKKYIPMDSGKKIYMPKEEKKNDIHFTCTKKILHLLKSIFELLSEHWGDHVLHLTVYENSQTINIVTSSNQFASNLAFVIYIYS